jgi:hypothetical protein
MELFQLTGRKVRIILVTQLEEEQEEVSTSLLIPSQVQESLRPLEATEESIRIRVIRMAEGQEEEEYISAQKIGDTQVL